MNVQQLEDTVRKTQLLVGDLQSANLRIERAQALLQQKQELTAAALADIPTQVENWIDNGNLDFTTDAYDNAIPVPGDAQEEAARWYRSLKDPSVRVTDSAILTGTPDLTSATGGFALGDVTKEIVVEGAGAAGVDLVTTIAAFVSANAVTLTANAGMTVTAAVTRWRLQTLSTAAAASLHTTAHSLYANDDPNYDKSNGWAALGSGAYDLCAPLNKNWVSPSKVINVAGICLLNPHVTDAGIDIGVDATRLNSADAQFDPGDVGKTALIEGAGPSGSDLDTTIAAYVSPTQVALSDAASTTVVGALATFSMEWPDTGTAIYAGIYDNTAGRRMFIEGSDFELRASVIGTPAGTTPREYLVVAKTDFGETLRSNKVTVATAPDNGSFVPGSVYVALSWKNLTGILHYDVYRNTGGVFHYLTSLDNAQVSYFDQNVGTTVVAGYPTTDATRPRAYVEMREGSALSETRKPNTAKWVRFKITIPSPQTYNMGLTTDRQWLRMGLTSALVGAGSKRALQIDLIGLNDRDGTFSRSVNDYGAKQQPSTSMTSSTQGGTGSEGGDNPDLCPSEDESTIVMSRRSTERVVKAIKLKRGMKMLTSHGWFAEIRKVEIGEPVTMWRMRTKLGIEREATAEDRIIRNAKDTQGKMLYLFKPGEPVRVYIDGKFFADRVLSVTKLLKKRRPVMVTLLGDDPTFIAGHAFRKGVGKHVGIVAHNLKGFEGRFGL